MFKVAVSKKVVILSGAKNPRISLETPRKLDRGGLIRVD